MELADTRDARINAPSRFRMQEFSQRHKLGLLALLNWFIIWSIFWERSWRLLSTPGYVNGDLASDGIMVSLAKRFALDHGHYSQFGFFHPGAAMFYFEALGQEIFFNILHIFPTEDNAQWATIILVNAAFIAASAFCLGVVFNSPRVIFATSFGVILYAAFPSITFMQSGKTYFVQPWVPIQTVWCFLFFLCSLIFLFAQKRSAFLIIGVAATLLAQRYLALVPFAAIGLIGGYFLAWKANLPTRKRDLRAGIIAILVLCIPNILGVIFDWPWQLRNYVRAAINNSRSTRGLRDAFNSVGSFWWLHHTVEFAVLILIGIAIAFVLWKRPASPQRNGYLGIVLAILGSTIIALVFAFFIISQLIPLLIYQMAFYVCAPMLAYVLISILVLRIGTAYVALPAILILGDFSSYAALGNTEIPAAHVAIVRAAHGKPIQYIAQDLATSWPTVAALELEDIRTGTHSCVQNGASIDQFLYTSDYVCSQNPNKDRVSFVVNPTSSWPNSTIVFQGPGINVVRLDP